MYQRDLIEDNLFDWITMKTTAPISPYSEHPPKAAKFLGTSDSVSYQVPSSSYFAGNIKLSIHRTELVLVSTTTDSIRRRFNISSHPEAGVLTLQQCWKHRPKIKLLMRMRMERLRKSRKMMIKYRI